MQNVRKAHITMPDGTIAEVMMEVNDEKTEKMLRQCIRTQNTERRIGFALNRGKKGSGKGPNRNLHTWINTGKRIEAEKAGII